MENQNFNPNRQRVLPVKKTNTYAILALVFGGLALPGLCACFAGNALAVLGIVFGFIAQSQIKSSGEQGAGLALAGIILSVISLVIGIVFGVIYGISSFADLPFRLLLQDLFF